jgi:hypothetical protein
MDPCTRILRFWYCNTCESWSSTRHSKIMYPPIPVKYITYLISGLCDAEKAQVRYVVNSGLMILDVPQSLVSHQRIVLMRRAKPGRYQNEKLGRHKAARGFQASSSDSPITTRNVTVQYSTPVWLERVGYTIRQPYILLTGPTEHGVWQGIGTPVTALHCTRKSHPIPGQPQRSAARS